ncbi:MAG: MerR family transcriptional regulator [Xanthomonadales bacterium]|nr:MerR family transcriptional regulator [Xanthomonadales bacterium]
MSKAQQHANTIQISALAKRYGLSRSTLLHYHKIGLLIPSQRGENGYRFYTASDCQRLEQIVMYREAGLSLGDIKALVHQQQPRPVRVLEQRLAQIHQEIQHLRKQQQLIVALLGEQPQHGEQAVLDKQAWVALLQKSGMSDDDMWQWHAHFEHSMPEQHEDFLVSLGIELEEIEQIRSHSRALIKRDDQ